MKIIYDYQIFFYQSYGGISRYFYELAKNINLKHSHSAKIIAGLYNNEYLQSESFVKGYKNKGLLSKLCRNRFYNKTESVCVFLAKLHQSHSSCDIYHETYYHSKLKVPAKAAIVTTIHDMIHEKFQEQYANAAEVIENKKKSILRANHIIAVSETTKKDIIDMYNISPEKISVVHHGVSPFNTFNKSTSQGMPKFTKPYLLYVGRRGGYKNAQLLLEVYATEKQLQERFDLVFMGSEAETNNEKEFGKLNHIKGNVHYLDGDDVLLELLYKNAFAFIYPSLYEGFGMPCLEAMQYNCPVIASNMTAIAEATGNAALLFEAQNSNDLIKKIQSLSENTTLRENFINLGKERAKQFTWKKTAEQTLAAYSKCIHG